MRLFLLLQLSLPYLIKQSQYAFYYPYFVFVQQDLYFQGSLVMLKRGILLIF